MGKDPQAHSSILDFLPKGTFNWRKCSCGTNRWGPEESPVSWSCAQGLLKWLLQGNTVNFLWEQKCELLAPCALEAQRQQIQLSGNHVSSLTLTEDPANQQSYPMAAEGQHQSNRAGL